MTKASEQADELVGNVMVGVREGLLPWARETLAINSNHDAYKAMDSGEVDLALSHINRSLRNHPNQPEMVQMREDLLGEESVQSRDGDILRGIFDRTFYSEPGRMPQSDMPKSDPLSSNSTSSSDDDHLADAVESNDDQQVASSGMESESLGTWVDPTAEEMPSNREASAPAEGETVAAKADTEPEFEVNPAIETASALESASTDDESFENVPNPSVETASALESATTMADSLETTSNPSIESSSALEESTTVAAADPSFEDAGSDDLPFDVSSSENAGTDFDSTLFDTQDVSSDTDEFSSDENETGETQSEFEALTGSANEFDGGNDPELWNLPGTEDTPFTDSDSGFDTFADITPASTIKVDTSNEGQQEHFSSAIPFESIEYSESEVESGEFTDAASEFDVQRNFMFTTLFRTSLLEWWMTQARVGSSMTENFASAGDQ